VPCADKEGERPAGALRFVHFASGNSRRLARWYRIKSGTETNDSARANKQNRSNNGEFEK